MSYWLQNKYYKTWQFSGFKNIHGQISSLLVHFNVKNCIGEIGKIVKNEILASTSVLSYLGGEMIKVSGLGNYMG